MITAIRLELRLLWRTGTLPVLIVVLAVAAVTAAIAAGQLVRVDFAQLVETRDQYRANGMDFLRDLTKQAEVHQDGSRQLISNLARYDYDNLATAIAQASPRSTVPEFFRYVGLVGLPVLIFLTGLRVSTAQRRWGVERVTVVREGRLRTIVARQAVLLICAGAAIAVALVADTVTRAIVTASLSADIPLGTFPPLTPPAAQDAAPQAALIAGTVVFFGWGGIAVGTAAGIFSVPAVLFVLWDLVCPVLGGGDPRSWFLSLGHRVFSYDVGFSLGPVEPMSAAVATAGVIGACVAVAVVPYCAIRLRNPLS